MHAPINIVQCESHITRIAIAPTKNYTIDPGMPILPGVNQTFLTFIMLPLPLLLILVLPQLVAANVPSLPALDINWATFVPKYTTLPPNVRAEQAFIQVPADYWSEYGAPDQRIRLRVRRFCRGNEDTARHHLWIIPGGPGGHSNAIEYKFGELHDYIPKGVWIYAMDHRGTGKSTKLMRTKVKRFDPNQVAAALPFPLQIMSVHNAAMDFVSVTNAIKQPGEHFYLMGESYGAFLSSYVYRLVPGLFNGAILDGFNPSLHIRSGQEPDLRHQLSAVCTKSRECKSLIDPARILTLVQEFINTDNPCTKKVFKRNDKVSKGAAVRRLILSIKEAYLSVYNQQATVAFLNGALMCANPAQFDAALSKLDVLEARALAESATKATNATAIMNSDGDGKKEIKKYRSQDADLLMHVIRYSEKQMDAGTCAPTDDQMLSRCELFDVDYYTSTLKNHLYEPKLPPSYSTNMNQVIVIAAKGDHRTPHDGAEDEYRNMSVGSKSFYSFDYAQHVSLEEATCGRQVMQQLIAENASKRESAKREAEACIDKLNKLEFPWLNFDPDLAFLWQDAKGDRPKGVEPPKIPTKVPPPEETEWDKDTIIIAIVFGVLASVTALSIAVIIIVTKVRKSRR